MKKVRKYFALQPQQRLSLLKAAVLLESIRLLLRILPYSSVRAFLQKAARRSSRLAAAPAAPKDLARAVEVAGTLVPGGKHCLSQALTLELLLLRRGVASKVCFGVRHDSREDLVAHAWLEHNGVVLIGGGPIHHFVELTPPPDSTA